MECCVAIDAVSFIRLCAKGQNIRQPYSLRTLRAWTLTLLNHLRLLLLWLSFVFFYRLYGVSFLSFIFVCRACVDLRFFFFLTPRGNGYCFRLDFIASIWIRVAILSAISLRYDAPFHSELTIMPTFTCANPNSNGL